MLEKLNTMEDLNSLLMLDPHYHDTYKINLGLLPSDEFEDYYYDFNVINMEKMESNFHKITKSTNGQSASSLYRFDGTVSGDTFIQFEMKVENINPKSKIGIYYSGFSTMFSLSALHLEDKKWANIIITKIGSTSTISINGKTVNDVWNIDASSEYTFAIALSDVNETVYVKNFVMIDIDEVLETNGFGELGWSNQLDSQVSDNIHRLEGNGWLTFGEQPINLFDGGIYLYEFGYNNSDGWTNDPSKTFLTIGTVSANFTNEGYYYKDWSVEKLGLTYATNIRLLIYNNKIYFFDEYELMYVDTLPTAENYMRFYVRLNGTIVWFDNFKFYKSRILKTQTDLKGNGTVVIDTKNLKHYTIEVYNKLWTGEVKFERLQPEAERPSVWTDEALNYNNERYIIHITYDSDDFDVILILDNDYKNQRKVETIKEDTPKVVKLANLKMVTDINKEYEYHYYQRPTIKLKCTETIGIPIKDVECTIFDTVYKSNSKGEISFIPPLLEPGVHYYDINMTKMGYDSTYCRLKLKVLKEECQIVFDDDQAYWGGYCTDTIKLKVNGKDYENVKIKIECPESNINKSVIKTLSYDVVNNEYSTTIEQQFRKKRLNQSTVKVTFEGNNYIEPISKTFIKKHERKIMHNWNELKDEINNPKGVDIVGMVVGQHHVDEMIQVRRDFEIQGVLGSNGWATFTNNGDSTPKYIFSIFPKGNDWITFNINSIMFTHLKKIMFLNGHTNTNVDNCLFLENSRGYRQDLGICIETNIGQTYIKKNYGNLNVTRSMFINNKGGCIASSYQTYINTCKFIVDQWNYVQHPQCYGVEIYGQKATIKDSDFILSMTGQSPLPIYQHSNFSHGSAPLRIGKQAYVNGQLGANMQHDNRGGLCSNNNTAYSYAKYLYDGVKVTLCPVKGKERCAYKHVVNGTNWAWHNNVRVNRTYDNTNRKPVIKYPSTPLENLKINKFGGREIW